MRRREKRLLLAQGKMMATSRYLRALRAAQVEREQIERVLMMLHKAARKGHGFSVPADDARYLSQYLDLLVTRIDLLSYNVTRKAARALVGLGVASEQDIPKEPEDKSQPRLFAIDGGKQDDPDTA